MMYQASNVEGLLAEGHELSQIGRFAEAEANNLAVLATDPNHALARNNLGWTRQMQGDTDGAITCYRKALKLDPGLRIARRNLACLLVRSGRGQSDESLQLFSEELLSGPEGQDWLRRLASTAMAHSDLTLAGHYAAILAALGRGSSWYPRRAEGILPSLPLQPDPVFLTIPKLMHDIEQFGYLQRIGVLGHAFSKIIADYRKVIARLSEPGTPPRLPLDGELQDMIGHVFNRIVHLRHAPRMKQALSGTWDAAAVERQYLDRPPGVVVIDDFLSQDALENLRCFCLESTVWFGNRYAHGRLGAFFHDGFNCPLLLQIAEELRAAFPRVIGDRYPLRQLWGFKNGADLPGDSTTHADFAAVNVNFWITPDSANLDPAGGGLVVYAVDAPRHWDFHMYNSSPDIIKAFLAGQQAHRMIIPYRQNRAVIFNSDLFHATSALRFRPGYENRRVNVTMLYGDREDDVHHRQLARPEPNGAAAGGAPAWRSSAFGRRRR